MTKKLTLDDAAEWKKPVAGTQHVLGKNKINEYDV